MSCENESQHPANERQRPQSGTHLNEQTRQNSENTPKSLRSSGEASSAGGALVASHSYSNSNTNPSPAAVEEAITSARRVGSEQCRAISRSTSSLHQLGKGFSLDSHSPGGEKRRRAMHTSRSQHKNSNTEQNAAFRSLMKHHTSSGNNTLPALLIASPAVSSGRISNLLSRIKERIQKHAIQTSSDWPLPPTLLRQASGQRMKLASAAAACSTPDSASARDATCNWTPGSAVSTRRQDRTRSLDSNSKENYSLTPESAGRAHLSRCTRLRAISSTVQPNLALLELQQQQEVALQKIQTPGSSRGTPTTGCSRKPDAKIELLGESEEPETRVSEWTSMRSPPDFYLRKRSSSSIDPSNKQPVRKLSARVESSQHSVTRLDTILIPGSTQMLDSPAYTSTCSSRTESPVLNTRRVGSRNGPQRLPPSLTLTVDSDEAARCALDEAVDDSAQQHCDVGARPSGGCNSASGNRSLRVRQMKDTRNWLAVQEDLPSVITEKSEHSDRSASSYGNGDRKPERSGASGSTRDRDRATDTSATASASKPEDTSRGEKDTSRREKRRNSGKGTTKTKKKVLKRVSSLRQGSTSSSDDCSRGIGERVVVDIEPSRYKQSCGESGRLSELNYDADGTTWGIWGADVDPEELGAAIQAHLQRLMQTAAATARQPAVGEQVPKSARPSLASGGGGDREGEQQQQHKQQAQERDSQSQQRRSARPSLQGSGSERGSKAGAASRQSLTSQERRSAGARGEPKTPIEISERIEVIEAPSSDSQELPRKRGGCRFFNCIG